MFVMPLMGIVSDTVVGFIGGWRSARGDLAVLGKYRTRVLHSRV